MEDSVIMVTVTHSKTQGGMVVLAISTVGGAVINHFSRDQTVSYLCTDTEEAVERLKAWIQSNVRATWDSTGDSDLWEVA